MDFGEHFVMAGKIVFAVLIVYFAITQLSSRIPFVGRYALLIIVALVAVGITFMFGSLIRGDANC
ncbi:Uncharacterised protein [uncultured archaeon]|nr:Uncharacterised protein [uncultured archaeon]